MPEKPNQRILLTKTMLKNSLLANSLIAVLLTAVMFALYLNVDRLGQPEELLRRT